MSYTVRLFIEAPRILAKNSAASHTRRWQKLGASSPSLDLQSFKYCSAAGTASLAEGSVVPGKVASSTRPWPRDQLQMAWQVLAIRSHRPHRTVALGGPKAHLGTAPPGRSEAKRLVDVGHEPIGHLRDLMAAGGAQAVRAIHGHLFAAVLSAKGHQGSLERLWDLLYLLYTYCIGPREV